MVSHTRLLSQPASPVVFYSVWEWGDCTCSGSVVAVEHFCVCSGWDGWGKTTSQCPECSRCPCESAHSQSCLCAWRELGPRSRQQQSFIDNSAQKVWWPLDFGWTVINVFVFWGVCAALVQFRLLCHHHSLENITVLTLDGLSCRSQPEGFGFVLQLELFVCTCSHVLEGLLYKI